METTTILLLLGAFFLGVLLGFSVKYAIIYEAFLKKAEGRAQMKAFFHYMRKYIRNGLD